MLDHDVVRSHVATTWDSEILPLLTEFVTIPALSPAFDDDWSTSGHIAAATELLRDWAARRAIAGATVEVLTVGDLTPVILLEVPPHGDGADRGDDTVLLYGHLDKQPEMTGWRDDLGPWNPVLDGDRLYGRGVADDGYALPAALCAIEAVHAAGGNHGRLVILIEASEESGSVHLPDHLEALGDRLGDVSLVIGLDSGMADWEHFWVTTSLRGLVTVDLRVDVLSEGVHSGAAGGVVPSSFDVVRQLLDRISDPTTGDVLLPSTHVEIPAERRTQAGEIAPVVGDPAAGYPFAGDTDALHHDATDLLLARSWGPAMEVIGLAGAPTPERAGNVLRPWTQVRLAIRIPPTAVASDVAAEVVELLTADPPHGAVVTATADTAESGWAAPATAPWLADALDVAGRAAFGGPPLLHGEGGTIPFMGMLGTRFPDAQFVITGVLGPGSNAHGPNEFLHVPSGKGVTEATAHLLDAHARR